MTYSNAKHLFIGIAGMLSNVYICITFNVIWQSFCHCHLRNVKIETNIWSIAEAEETSHIEKGSIEANKLVVHMGYERFISKL